MGLETVAQCARFGHPFGNHVEHRVPGVEQRLLRHINATRALLRLQLAVVDAFQPSQNLQQ